MQKDSRGFSWLELILVVLIIVLVLAITLPSLTKSRAQLNQIEAVRSLRRLTAAEATYAGAYNKGYAPTLSSLGPPPNAVPTASAAGLVDTTIASGAHEGYKFVYTPGPADANGKITSYAVTASPQTTGSIFYFTDQSGIIRMNASSTASAADSPVGG